MLCCFAPLVMFLKLYWSVHRQGLETDGNVPLWAKVKIAAETYLQFYQLPIVNYFVPLQPE